MSKIAVFICIALPAAFASCARNELITSPQPGAMFEVDAAGYSTNHFFVDTSYIAGFEANMLSSPPFAIVPGREIAKAEVWISRAGIGHDPNEYPCIALTNLAYAPGGPSSFKPYGQADSPGIRESGIFVPLGSWEYALDGALGLLSVYAPFTDQQTIGISFLTNGIRPQQGQFISDLPVDSLIARRPLFICLVKPKILLTTGPAYTVAWRLMAKNFYPLGSTWVGRSGLFVNIVRRAPGNPDQRALHGRSFLNILGLDLYDPNGLPVPGGDGRFDFLPGHSIDPEHGEIFFPYNRPFDTGIVESFAATGGTQPDPSYRLPRVYDTTASAARAAAGATYVIQVWD